MSDNRQNRWFSAVPLVFFAVLLAAQPSAGASEIADRSAGKDTVSLKSELVRLVPFGFSGAVLIADKNGRVHASGYGFADRDAARPNTAGTAFDIGSLSKQFTAAAVLKLSELGKLSVTDTIGGYLPRVPEDKRRITIHHLLTHTSGLPEFHDDPGRSDTHGDFQVMTREEAEQRILNAKLAFTPGEKWRYSNSGYTLLAAIVERVSKQPFETFLQEQLFRPAKMAHTGLYFQGLWDEASVAHGYTGASGRGAPVGWTETDELWALIGNGGVVSTIEDLERWDRALRNTSVLSRKSVKLFFTPHARVREGVHYGYGWLVDNSNSSEPVVRHGGANDFGFASRWRRNRKTGRLIVLLLNREPPGMDAGIAANTVLSALQLALRGQTAGFPPETRQDIPGGADRYAGRYRLRTGDEFAVRSGGGSLVIEPLGPGAVRYLAFPGASSAEWEAVRELDRKAAEIIEGITKDDYGPFARALADPEDLDFFQEFISDWWNEFRQAGGKAEDVRVLGTVPMWWNPGDDRLATLLRASLGDRQEIFRLHWRGGAITNLGGGAIREPATTLAAPAKTGGFVAYHLGIRQPVLLSFETDSDGRVTGMHLKIQSGTVTAPRVK
ncbi:MAG: serine hydrolase domain-containing protein [Alphaproteobacteria bacterium]